MVLLLTLLTASAGNSTVPFQFEGWPGEGIPKFTVKSPISMPMKSEARTEAQQYGTCDLGPGSSLDYSMSTMVVREPPTVTLKKKVSADITTYGRLVLLTHSAYYDKGKAKTITVDAGDQVQYLMPRAEGRCFFRYKGEVFEADCFGEFMSGEIAATQSEWWIQIECADSGGWVHLDPVLKNLSQTRSF